MKLIIEFDLEQVHSGADVFGNLASLIRGVGKAYGFAEDLRAVKKAIMAETKIEADSPILARITVSPEPFEQESQIPPERQFAYRSNAVPEHKELVEAALRATGEYNQEKPS